MELLKNFENICRVCGGGIQSKKQEQHSAIYCIFTTVNLKDNLEKYLLLEIKENDNLPRYICSFCFKKINSIIEFANSAKNFESFLKQFLTMQIKQPQISLQYPHLSKELNNLQTYKSHIQELPLWSENETTPRKTPVKIIQDVVVNVSPTDPITRDKLVQAKKRHSGSFVTPKKYISTKNLKEVKFVKKPPPMIVNPATMPNVSIGPVNSDTRPISVCNFAKETLPTLPDFHTVNDCLNLGSVIKDKDLLKLILKALKWPYDKHTLNAQIQRLKCTRFRDIMVDPLLLQDTDLIQILTQYFGPNFKFQQSSSPPMETRKSPPPLQPIIPQSLAYKLPAETSIQVINVPKSSSPKKRRKPVKITDVIVLSDDENDSCKKPESMEVNVDPMLYFGENSNSDENKPTKRKNLSHDKKPRRRKQSLTSIHSRNNGVEDLVIMGQQLSPTSTLVSPPALNRTPQHITYKKKTKSKAIESVSTLNLNEYDDENPLVIDDSSIDIWENVEIDESAAINQVDHLIGESTKIVEIEMTQKTFADADSTTIVANPDQVNKELLLPPDDVLIKDSLKFDESEGEEVDVLGFELQQTDDSEKNGETVVVVEEKLEKVEKKEKVQKEKEEQIEEPMKETEEEWPSVPKRRRLLKPERSKEAVDVEDEIQPSKEKEEIKKTTETISVSSSRPARKSKTFSKYYKDPSSTDRSQTPVRASTRTTKGSTSRRK
ncbi:hypothetical protein ACFFRR_004364 [Megaselia abdita]